MMPFSNPYKKQRTASSPGVPPRRDSPFSPPMPFVTVHVPNDPACFCLSCQQLQQLDQEDPNPVLVSPPREERIVRAATVAPAAAAAAPVQPPVSARRSNDNPVQDRILPLSQCVQYRHYGAESDGRDALALTQKLARLENISLEPANGHARRVVNTWDAPEDNHVVSALANGALRELAGIGMNVASVRVGINDLFSPVVASCFVSALSNIGIHRLSHAGNIAPRDETRDNARAFANNYKANFLFVPLMTTEKKLSTLNCCNAAEFYYNDAGDKFTNPSYWEDSVSIRRFGGRSFSSIEIGAFIPDWTIPDAVLQDHQLAMTWLAENGPVFSNGQAFYLSLKQEYVTVFIRNMQSPLVACARKAGFFPVFAAKNIIVQKTENFGINGAQMTTINMQPRSYLALVGFAKGNKDNLQIVTIKNDNNELMVLPNHAA